MASFSIYQQDMISALFSQREFDLKYNPCIWAADEMGEFFRFRRGVAEDYFWYPDFAPEVLFKRWEQTVKEIPGVRFRSIQAGFDHQNFWRQSLMEKGGSYYLVRGAKVSYGSDKDGPRGAPCYTFNTENTESGQHLVKTEIGLKKMLNKLEVRQL